MNIIQTVLEQLTEVSMVKVVLVINVKQQNELLNIVASDGHIGLNHVIFAQSLSMLV